MQTIGLASGHETRVCHACRAGFAGRGTPLAREREAMLYAFDLDPKCISGRI
jgi:hypothetical protein